LAHPEYCPCTACSNWRTIIANRKAMAEHIKQQKANAREQTLELVVMYSKDTDEFEFAQDGIRVRGKIRALAWGPNMLESEREQLPVRNFNLLSNDAAFRVLCEARLRGFVRVGNLLGEDDG
jgi:hypothetical protein